MITLNATETLKAIAGTNSALTWTLTGLEILTGVETYKVLDQRVLSTSISGYTVPASTMTMVKELLVVNTTALPVTISFYINGSAVGNQIAAFTIPANGHLTLDDVGWQVYSNSGTLTSAVSLTLTGDVTGTGSSSIPTVLATVNSNVGPFGSATAVPSFTVNSKGLTTAAANIPIQIAESQVTGLATDLGNLVPTSRTISTTAPLAGGGALSGNLSLTISAATTGAAGSMSAVDKLKLDNLWIDVTANTTALMSTANTAAQNITAINAILAAAPNGSTIFFPHGAYLFNAAWTMPNKMFTFIGEGSNRAGSPATAFTELKWNANVGATLITMAGSGNAWYTRFKCLTFTTTVDQTVGGIIDANGNVGIDFIECSAQSNGGFFNDVLIYGGGGGSNSGNSTVVNNCHIQGYKGTGVRVNAAGSSIIISDSVIQGQWGNSAQMATAGISGGFVGALQINDCDVLGNVNNLLINPVVANSEVAASVFCTNTYFDFALGSCIKITGTGATVRCRFDTCSFTTGTGATALSAVEINSSFAYADGGQGIDFVNCNVLNTFSTTGTTNGFLISGTADFSISNCRVAGWTNGVQVTPIATAGRTQLSIINNTIGPAGGFVGNTVGILLNVGGAAYGSMNIVNNVLRGNTTAMTDNSAVGVGSIKNIARNVGWMAGLGVLPITNSGGAAVINPRGTVTSSTTETFLFNCKIPANSVGVGQGFRLKAYAQTSGASVVQWRLRAGAAGTIAGDTAVIWIPTPTVVANTVANGWVSVDVTVYVVALGATATINAAGIFQANGGTTFSGSAGVETLPNVPTTADWYFDLTCSSSVGTVTIRDARVEAL